MTKQMLMLVVAAAMLQMAEARTPGQLGLQLPVSSGLSVALALDGSAINLDLCAAGHLAFDTAGRLSSLGSADLAYDKAGRIL